MTHLFDGSFFNKKSEKRYCISKQEMIDYLQRSIILKVN